MISEQDRSRIIKAKQVAYWSKLEKEHKSLARWLSKSGFKTQLGLLNDHHIEIIDLYDDPCDICFSLWEMYHFDLLIQRVKNKIKTYDARTITRICHDDDPDWDRSGHLEDTDHILDLSKPLPIRDVLGLYTGDKVASFISGMGFIHRQLKEEILDMIGDYIYDPQMLINQKKLLEFAEIEGEIIDDHNMDDFHNFLTDHLFADFVLFKTSSINVFK